MAAGLPTPELLDADIDSAHRSYLSAVEHRRLRTFRCRPPAEYVTLARLVEGGPVGRDGRDRPRMVIDPSLITALIDRWRPETHKFHLPCGEMTPTLQDVSYLLGLPIVGEAVGPRVIGQTWMEDLEVRFAAFNRLDHLGALEAHPSTRGPSKKWLLQFQATNLHPDADDESVSLFFEAYLLWLFGFIMFKNGHGNTVDKILMPYAGEIADADEDQVLTWSWGSAVLAATYRGLCDACIKDDDRARFQGCALLLQLWSYERLAVGRPIVDHRPYELQYYEDEDDRPTMGTLWVCSRERTWANEQARRTYPNFVAELDRLKADDVVWEPYSPQAVATRAPYGLSSWCTSNSGLWLTKTCLVYDIYVESHCPDRVMRQFGYQQPFPVPRALDQISRGDHRLSRLGQPCSSTWVQKLKPYVDAWDEADEDVFEPIGNHTDEWIRVTYAETQQVAHEATSTDTYARHRDEALAGAICCQLQSHAHSALTRVQGGNPFSMTEQLEGLTWANEGFLSMMQAWGVSPRMEVAPVQQPSAPPQQTAPSWPYPSMDAPSTSYMPMGPPPMSFPHMGTPSLQPMGPPAFTLIYPRQQY
ncbi:hypothetical protein U9M48_020007 [Paspalum notatum var. saurae]|uniref:Aminotransferase-like plant mobile domain-containing protein n=1 Tax=Paspalum notatum var. saurae TaxID=547442 RepID=A0AAQ3TE72_PASNO